MGRAALALILLLAPTVTRAEAAPPRARVTAGFGAAYGAVEVAGKTGGVLGSWGALGLARGRWAIALTLDWKVWLADRGDRVDRVPTAMRALEPRGRWAFYEARLTRGVRQGYLELGGGWQRIADTGGTHLDRATASVGGGFHLMVDLNAVTIGLDLAARVTAAPAATGHVGCEGRCDPPGDPIDLGAEFGFGMALGW